MKITDRELDCLYNYIDYLLRREQFAVVDFLLIGLILNLAWNTIDCFKKDSDLSIDEILGYLTVTLPAKSKLKNRDSFVNAARKILDKEDAALIRGLE